MDNALNIRVVIGWQEWVSLPELGLPVIKAKIDTGAATSALHAFDLHPFEYKDHLWLRFKVHPIQNRDDLIVGCEALVIDHRVVSNSGGQRERRYVIRTPLKIGDLTFPIEMTLTNRESMKYRMLLGRGAMENVLIDPKRQCVLGRPVRTLSAYLPATKSNQAQSKDQPTSEPEIVKALNNENESDSI